MSLILAIEPDPLQSQRLRDLVRRRLSADLVHASTTEGALAALAQVGDRVPDLVLVPSLLSAHEDAAIAGALRVIAAAANVSMLTIPLLADPEPPVKAQGMLARLRGKKPKVTSAGCDPEVFADQIATYLAEAAAERKAKREEEELGALGAPGALGALGAADATGALEFEAEAIETAARIDADREPIAEPEPPIEPAPIVVPQQTYKPLIIQPVSVAPPEPVSTESYEVAPILDEVSPKADAWPDRSGEAMREIERVSQPAPVMFDAPVVAAVGEAVIVPAEPPADIVLEVSGEVPAESPVVAAAIESPAIVDTQIVSAPPIVEPEPLVAALLQSLAEPVAEPPADAAPLAVPEPVVAVAQVESLPEPIVTVDAAPPAVEQRPEEVKARFWGSRIRIPKVVAKLVTPKVVTSPEPEQIDEPVAASPSLPEPTVDVPAAVVDLPAPVVALEAPVDVTTLEAAAPEIVIEVASEPVVIPEPIVEVAAAPPKSRLRLPKQSSVRKPAPKPRPTRDEREEIDIDALIAPLLTEMAARRTTADPKPVEPPPVVAAVPPTPEIDPMFFADDAMTVPPPTPAQAERSAWIELVDSLRQDIERLKAERQQPAAPPAPVEEAPQLVAANPVPAVRRRPAAAVVQMPTPPARAPRPNPRRPVQDQWGLFDPEQCGFAALLAKLDEIGTRDEASA